jgi:hypothetical protein
VAGETHGLIAAAQDLPGTYTWGCDGTDIAGADGIAIGIGEQNTLDIVSAGCGGAAAACANLVLNDYDDWFLPSRDELQQLYNNRLAIGGFQSNWYWSSSEGNFSGVGARGVFFVTGSSDSNAKHYNFYVRPVRFF